MKIYATRALCGRVSRYPTQISHLGFVLILWDENSIYKHARYYPFKGLKHSTGTSIAQCATATWHFTLQLTRIRLSWTPFGRKNRPAKPITVRFLSFVVFIRVNYNVLRRNVGASSAFTTEASEDDTLFHSKRKTSTVRKQFESSRCILSIV